MRGIYLKGEKERYGGHLDQIYVSRLNKMDLNSGIWSFELGTWHDK